MTGRSAAITWAGLLVAVCCCTAEAQRVQPSTFRQAADMDGMQPSTNPLFHEADTSDIDCARVCSKHPLCEAFTFVGDGDGSCLGYNRSVMSNTTSHGTAVSGARTYTMSVARSCQELVDSGLSEGVIKLWSDTHTPSYVGPAFCDGPWLVFQRRQDGAVDFYRDWADYRNGFGDVEGEHWLGLEAVRQLTSQGQWTLRVDMADRDGNYVYATYSNFSLGSEDRFYPLLYDSYTGGTVADSMTQHLGQPFTTRDRDHDNANDNCAVTFHGAWWYNMCLSANLNGDYNSNGYGLGVIWNEWKGFYYSLPFVQMKMQKL